MPTARPVHAQPDPDRALSHLAMRALVALRAVDACLDAIDGPHREGALRALRFLHEPKAVEGVIKKLLDGDTETVTFLRGELARQGVQLDGLPDESVAGRPKAEEEIHVLLAKADPKNRDQIGNMTYEAAASRSLGAKGSAERGKALFAAQSCRACHTDADGQTPKGPHLVDIGKRYSPAELVESILKPSAKIAQGYEAYRFAMADGRVFTGFVVSEGPSTVSVRETSGALHELKRADIEERRWQEPSTMPEGIAGTLTPEQLADLVAYLQSLTQ
jgi:putative heme-binding domain-containing protein